MCKAFSCVIMKSGTVYWKLGMDSHSEILDHFKIKDDTADPDLMEFARCEVTPDNGNYLYPDKWTFHLDERIKPSWWSMAYELYAREEKDKWYAELEKKLIRKPIVNPFKIDPPKRITKKRLGLLKQWDSVRASVRGSVWDSVRASVRASVGASVRASVWASVGASVRDSVWDSVWASVRDSAWASVGASVLDSVWGSVGDSVWGSVSAYIGSFFSLDRSEWTYTDKIKTDGYPFQASVDLWEMGLVPSFDGDEWRLHGGEGGKVLWKGKIKE